MKAICVEWRMSFLYLTLASGHLSRMMGLMVPPLGEQIDRVKQLSGGQDGKVQLDQQYNRLKQLLSRGNGEAAYCALGILLEKIKKRNSRWVHGLD